MKFAKAFLVLLFLAAGVSHASSFIKAASDAAKFLSSGDSVTVQHSGAIEVAFSPNGGAEELVVKVIHSAKKSIRMAGYSFTSKPIAIALVDAKKRGVDVMAVLDKSQMTEKYSGATFLANEGIPTRIDSRYAIMHHKFLVIDAETVQQGSFNYTSSAATRNAENAMVVWRNPALAQAFLRKWEGYWAESQNLPPRY